MLPPKLLVVPVLVLELCIQVASPVVELGPAVVVVVAVVAVRWLVLAPMGTCKMVVLVVAMVLRVVVAMMVLVVVLVLVVVVVVVVDKDGCACAACAPAEFFRVRPFLIGTIAMLRLAARVDPSQESC